MMLRFRWVWLSIGYLLIALVVFLSLMSQPVQIHVTHSDKLLHALAYFTMMFWFAQIYQSMRGRIYLACALTLLGVVIELLQYAGGTRYMELLDVVANTSGILLAWGVSLTPLSRLLYALESSWFVRR